MTAKGTEAERFMQKSKAFRASIQGLSKNGDLRYRRSENTTASTGHCCRRRRHTAKREQAILPLAETDMRSSRGTRRRPGGPGREDHAGDARRPLHELARTVPVLLHGTAAVSLPLPVMLGVWRDHGPDATSNCRLLAGVQHRGPSRAADPGGLLHRALGHRGQGLVRAAARKAQKGGCRAARLRIPERGTGNRSAPQDDVPRPGLAAGGHAAHRRVRAGNQHCPERNHGPFRIK